MLSEEVAHTILELSECEEFKKNPCFYMYDADDIEEKLSLIAERPSNVSFYYAMKANSNQDILRLIRSSPSATGLEIASCGELKKAQRLFSPEEIIYTGPGKTPYELELAVQAGIRLINVESEVEAARLERIGSALGKNIDVLIRVNTNYHIDEAITNMAGESTKMGIDQDKIVPALKRIASNSHLNIRGVHVFSASGVLDAGSLISYVGEIFRLVNRLEEDTGLQLGIIDFGGGFGVDYSGEDRQFDSRYYFSELERMIDRNKMSSKEMILELGRFVVGESGYYVAEIIDIKNSKGKKHIVAAGGVNHLRLPSASGINQPVYIVGRDVSAIIENQCAVHDEVVDIGGPLCFSEDKLAHDVYVAHAEIGNLVVVAQAGAYGYSVSSLELLSHPLPPEYLLHCGKKDRRNADCKGLVEGGINGRR
jgi:diaminopimelate decarboxylase